MFLILEVVSANARALGAAARMVFTLQGGSIGRRSGNDWVLPDPHVSGQHARIRALGGTFFVEDNNSGNGVTINGNRVHPGEPFPLKDGDVVYIDPFEIAVRVSASQPGALPVEPVMPAHPPAVPKGSALPATGHPAPGGIGGLDDLIGAGHGTGEFNPLLDSPAASTPMRIPSGVDLLAKPVLHDAIAISPPRTVQMPPPVVQRPSAPAGIPTNWDLSEPAAARPTPPPAQPMPPPAAVPPAPQPAPPPRPAGLAPGPRPTGPPNAPKAVPPAVAAIDAGSPDLLALLRGAGLDIDSVDPAIAAELGSVLRIVVEGLMEVMRARGEIKAEFRLQQTTFKPRENNPLKFSVNVEDALHNLLVKRNAAYLDAPAAFEDAFVDVRHHQLAMLAGMRAAFKYMLTRFDPKGLAAQFDARPGRKLSIGLGAGSRHWDGFEEYFKEITHDEDDCFRRLFGDHFARAYEEQLQRLRAERRKVT